MIGKITKGLANPGAIWTDAKGDVFVGNDMTYTSSVTQYAARTYKLIRTYTNGIDLPFGEWSTDTARCTFWSPE